MPNLNENYKLLKNNYLFTEISNRVKVYESENKNTKLIKMGIGDVTRPLVPAVIEALHKAVDEMGTYEGFRGYGPEQGYEFLRKAISDNDYKNKNIKIEPDEIFVSDGAKSDTGNITELFSVDNIVMICDPVYPVYLDTNIMIGRKDNIRLLECTSDNNFSPTIPTSSEKGDIIYLCFPNNPTGVSPTKEYLEKWVNYALENNSVILYDAAYEGFILDNNTNTPKSIFEIQGAKKCAIEFRSFSKTGGFTGLRCAYTVIPNELEFNGTNISKMWLRRQTTKFNGVPYIVQRAAEAIYSEEGKKQTIETIEYYLRNAKYINDSLKKLGLTTYGGENSPYVWVKTPNNMNSWDYFDIILNKAGIVCTPGSGFGSCGDEFVRFSAFNTYENTVEAMERLECIIK